MVFYLILGNDAANVLAESVSNNITDFVSLMNKKAKELGCTNTNFVNAHGYHNNNHYSTARDMIKILNYCIKNETFLQISSTKKYTISATNITLVPRYLQNSNRLLETKEDSIYGRYYKYCICGKTGYTEEAGRCLVSFGKKDGKCILVGAFNSKDDISGEDAKFTDTINLFEYCFNNFEKSKVIDKSLYNFDYLNKEKHVKYTLGIKNDISGLINTNVNLIKEVTYKTEINYTNLTFKEDNADYKNPYGKITFTITTDLGKQDFTTDLFVNKVHNLFYISPIILFITIFLFILVLLFIILIAFVKSRKRYKKKKITIDNTKISKRAYLRKRNRSI